MDKAKGSVTSGPRTEEGRPKLSSLSSIAPWEVGDKWHPIDFEGETKPEHISRALVLVAAKVLAAYFSRGGQG